MDKDKALEKIKKCLALGKSVNENEAAQALKQAQALMRKYSLTDDDVALADVTEFTGEKVPSRPPEWQAGLADTVCKAFGVRYYLDGYVGAMKVYYYGVGNKPELAAYAHAVLLRQLKEQRREYMATVLKRVRLSKNKTYRANAFCMGWVLGVWGKVDKFANGEREPQLLQQYGDQLGLRTVKNRTDSGDARTRQQGRLDRAAGWQMGKDVQLHHAMSGAQRQQQLTGGLKNEL